MLSSQLSIKKLSRNFTWFFCPSCLNLVCILKAHVYLGWFSWWLRQRICQQCGRPGFIPWVGKIPWRREWQPIPLFWPGEFHGQRLYSPWGCKEQDTAEQLTLSLFQVLCVASCFHRSSLLMRRQPGVSQCRKPSLLDWLFPGLAPVRSSCAKMHLLLGQ